MNPEEELKKLKSTCRLQESALNILIMAYWKLYYDQASFPGADAVRRIEERIKKGELKG